MWIPSVILSPTQRCVLRRVRTGHRLTYRSIPLRKTGMIPNLIMTLSQHASLAQEVSDATVKHAALSYLSRCKHDVANLTVLADEGRLPDVVNTCTRVDAVLESPPAPLENANISAYLKVSASRRSSLSWS